MGLLSEVFRNPANLDKLTGTSAIGHVRYATAGEASVDNIQPFLFRFHDMQFGLAHNGNLTNAESLKKELEQRGQFSVQLRTQKSWLTSFVGVTIPT